MEVKSAFLVPIQRITESRFVDFGGSKGISRQESDAINGPSAILTYSPPVLPDTGGLPVTNSAKFLAVWF